MVSKRRFEFRGIRSLTALASQSIDISTPRLVSVQRLTPHISALNNIRDLGADSEMKRARRVEQAVAFWRNQTSFHLSPDRKLSDLVDSSVEGMPSEFRCGSPKCICCAFAR